MYHSDDPIVSYGVSKYTSGFTIVREKLAADPVPSGGIHSCTFEANPIIQKKEREEEKEGKKWRERYGNVTGIYVYRIYDTIRYDVISFRLQIHF